ncbi:uncharacterized protein LOC105922141 isoform X2 [Fundulus heteroclitus]|uniref:uncharacterized protein LOC105922141 isoform X2 n=1 Tax=Fundulus heteroclitus TaxID=8078 RepID=UPI00165B1DB2|nr:uncharacterized protein LOC105922141 isoform X2 [Fundulus heteroclitus]
MLVLELVLIIVLQFEGIRGQVLFLYHKPGDDVVLPCNSPSFYYSCSIVNWIYSRDTNSSFPLEVQDGKVVQSSPRAARLNVDSKCSLIINNITAEDAGWYTCRPDSGIFDVYVHLSVLTVSPSPPGADPTKDGDFTLQCSLETFRGLVPCPEKSLLWVDETRSELLGEGVGFKSGGQTGCDSNLTVKLQSSSNRRYTCQFVEDNTVKVEAHYTPVFKVIRGEGVHIYHRAGDDAVLSCKRPSSSLSCSAVDWFYTRAENITRQHEVHGGKVQSSARAARLRLDNNCSLIINNITAEDAGRYTCQLWDGGRFDTDVYLNMMSRVPANRTIIILGAVICVLLLLVVLAAVFIKPRKTRVKKDHSTTTDQDSAHESHHHDEVHSIVIYATVDHFKDRMSNKIKDEVYSIVTYATVDHFKDRMSNKIKRRVIFKP